ncbi:General alpha-glucoside permease [Zalerion maritima]|uniref:General alpha-glucoside permease n=1 Tax=Zalerion maritima TaxID=339359 RepID=A0AAD5RVC8_9PEZI|nr:General alpha-glucoside permease [Zalerion maritima]
MFTSAKSSPSQRALPTIDLPMTQEKADAETVENRTTAEQNAPPLEPKTDGGALLMRTKDDDRSIWQTAQRHKLAVFIGLTTSFCASLDGYQINLNGGIIANDGFVQQFADSETGIIAGKYISAWSGIQSAGQTVGQILLQYVTEGLGRKPAFIIIWVVLVASIFTETFASSWDHWLVAKLLSGMGVGMLQSTMPLYLSEIAPTQLKGFFINAYSFWFVLGQLFASVALERLGGVDPMNYKTPIYTQWPMVGLIGIVFFLLPESPWWLASKGKFNEAAKVLHICNGHIEGYDVDEHIEVMSATIVTERQIAEQNKEIGKWAVFKGRNLLRFIISAWPKIAQQFVGLAVFNTNAVYFFQNAGNENPFLVTVILSCVQLISMILTATLTDKLGRRPLTVYPYGVTVISVLCLGIIGCFDYTAKETSSLLVFFACLATFSTTGASAIGYAYTAEIPQQRLRARTAGWALALSNAIGIMFSFCTPLMINGSATHWGVKTGFFFAGTGAVAVVIAWFILPEVTRRTPGEIDELFEKRVNLRKFDKYVTEVQIHSDEVHGEKGTA